MGYERESVACGIRGVLHCEFDLVIYSSPADNRTAVVGGIVGGVLALVIIITIIVIAVVGVSREYNYSVVSQKRAHGWCTLILPQEWGWPI